MTRFLISASIIGALLCSTQFAAAAEIQFKYHSPGDLLVGTGRKDRTIYFPGITFPLAVGPSAGNAQAFANSQIHGSSPFRYPWHDTYCEPRQWSMPLCPSAKGHQGDDISPSTKENAKWPAVAMDDGVVTSISAFTNVTIRSDRNFYCRYMHMDRASIAAAGLKVGQKISRGTLVGKVSNIMGGKPDTSIHLHFDCYKVIGGKVVRLPVYTSLISAYRVAWGLGQLNNNGNLGIDLGREVASGPSGARPPEAPADVLNVSNLESRMTELIVGKMRLRFYAKDMDSATLSRILDTLCSKTSC